MRISLPANSTALKPSTDVVTWPPTFLPSHWRWGNLAEVERAGPFLRWYFNSVLIAAITVAGNLIEGFRRPFLIEGHELFVTPSIGIAVCPETGAQPSTLLRNAHTAMYRAKEAGRNGYAVSVADMNLTARRRLALEAELHNALEAGQLRVLYQPQIDLQSGGGGAISPAT